MSVTFEALECWWCLYLKSVSTLTSRRILHYESGRHTIIPKITELIQCSACGNELNNLSLRDQIKLIVDYKPELKDWITPNISYITED